MATVFSIIIFAALAGFLSGLLGIGGGLILVPLFYKFLPRFGFEHDLMQVSVSSAFLVILFTTFSSSLSHYKLGHLNFKILKKILLFFIIPSFLTRMIIGTIESSYLKYLFVFTSFSILILLFAKQKQDKKYTEIKIKHVDKISFIFIAIISALIGISGGAILTPYLVFRNLKYQNSIAISVACGFCLAFAVNIANLLAPVDIALPSFTLGYAYLPFAILGLFVAVIFAPIGSKISDKLNDNLLKYLLVILLLTTNINLLLS